MTKRVEVVENILNANDTLADSIRKTLDEACVLGINMMASPGAGKTTLIEKTVPALAEDYHISVVDGDIASSIDADRAAAAGAQAVQINTGGSCHLDAAMLQPAVSSLDLSETDLLLVENVGNLICPASFQLGTHKSILIASIPEGDDKPYKYPVMYRGVDVLLISKLDLLPYIPFDMDYFRKGVEALNPELITFPLSAHTGEGMDAWLDWLRTEIQTYKAGC